MTDTTALAPQAAPQLPARSLVADLAAQAGVDPKKFYEAVKVACHCKGAEDAHFMVLLMQAEKYGLDPLSSPPQLQLLDVGNGPQVYARLDAYKSFLHRAEAAGKIEWRKYEEGWFPDPRQDPAKKLTRRGGRVTMKLRGAPEPVEKTVWFDEWSGKGQWINRGSHMLEGRAWKEACRDWLGFFLYDADDADKVGDSVKRVEAEVSDAREAAVPAIRIPTLTRQLPPPPAALELEPQTEDVLAASQPESRQVEGRHPLDAVPPPAGLDEPVAQEPATAASPKSRRVSGAKQAAPAASDPQGAGTPASTGPAWEPSAEEEAEIRRDERRAAGLFEENE